MSAQAPSPAASGRVSPPTPNASSPSTNGSTPGSNSSPPPQQIRAPSPPSPPSPPPASSPPPPSTNPTTPPPVSSPPPSNSKVTPPSPSPPVQSPPPTANAQSPAGSPPPPANAPPAKSSPPPVNASPPAQSPPAPANVSPPVQSPPTKSSPPPKSSPTSPTPSIKPSTPPPAESPSKSSTLPPSIVSPTSSSPPPPSLSSPPKSSPTPNSPSPKESPPTPETPAPAGISSPPSSTTPGIGSSSSPTPNSTTPGTGSSSSPTPKSTLADGSPSSGNAPIAAITGIAVGALVVFAVFGVLFWYIRKKKRRDTYPGNYDGPAPPGSFSRKSDGVYASNAPNSNQYLARASSSTATPGYGYDNGYQGSKYSSGDAIAIPAPQVATSGLGNSKSWFTYEDLAIATNGFAPQNVLGEGGFGCVYKGYLEGGKVVAVKQLKIGGGQGEREFRAEVEIISRVHHRHLVSLVGYCIADSQRLLVYEYVPNGTLEYHLHGRGRPVMDWPTRLRIAIGAARGIAYLHEDCHPRIIHRDIKSANILLDDRFEAQVSDFGLAKLALDAHTHVTTRVMGTFGYMAPEYASSGKLTQRSDVFSFGVVLLELVTGRKPVDTSQPLGDESLVEWARPLLSHALEEGNFEALVDPRLEKNFDRGEMFRMIEAAAACVRHSAQRRPQMGQVVRALESDTAMADLNNGVKPGQSTMYNSAQYSADIRRFRRMAFGSQDVGSDFSGVSSEYDMNPSTSSSECHKSKEVEAKRSRHLKTDFESASGSEYPSSESETRPINISHSHKDETGERSSDELRTNFRSQPLKGR
ncbi:hypothetical protein SUGI_0289930 [Cryptomeria japonica]|uniref:proline-rich receptor-like protein kinase PERK8 n=1 Tax=Cryptomeria japonica TaxID=3369 RepID=UPI002408E2C0|nr:proline-rich receptor-like protein kinase PERK8 [Cryptomeria japonica]XP_057821020.1 proline-rich receptor-like protein kinase PERK8 [Cryptomeria japonica]GLJ16827.1 hypothetical protein SUGI_0289930 [Cryptomeria japonica]